jgi:Organic solute transport protein 1
MTDPQKSTENSFGCSKASINYIMYLNLGSEMLYILNNRIKSLEIDDAKRISILSQIATNLYQNEENDRVLRETKTLIAPDALNSLLYKICHKSVITLDSSSFSKMVEMILMALKKDVELMKNDFGIIQVTLNHITSVDTILRNTSISSQARTTVTGFFNSMRNYDFFMLKRDFLNFLLFKHSKISIYLRDNIQANDGHFYIRPGKLAGFYTEKTGTIKLSDGVPIGDSVRGLKPFTATEKFAELVKKSGGPTYQTRFRPLASYKDEENDKLGVDLFENLKKNELVIVDKEYLTKISEDMTTKILGAQSAGSKQDIISLDLDFSGPLDNLQKESASAPSKITGSSFQVFSSNFDKGASKVTQKIDGLFGDDLNSNPGNLKKEPEPKSAGLTGKDLLDMMDDF